MKTKPKPPKKRTSTNGKRPKPAPRKVATAPKQPAPTAPDATQEAPVTAPAHGGFPIVGIGASAGGLEALEQFLRNVPEKSGMAFVVIQHLDPTHKGAMVELLGRASKMPVVEVKDRQTVEPDHVYVIPPGKDISTLHGVLHLLPMTSPRGLNLPIDYFFRSLAQDRQESSIGVVLSGMGSDGTLGLRAIKEKAGATFVQSLQSAKFDGMPRSAIDAGLADVVASVEELPARIIAYHEHAPYVPKLPPHEPEGKQQSALEKVLVLLRTQCGHDFSLYKRSTIERRIERRMGLHQIDQIREYVRYLRDNPRETELLFKELLIGVTSFFRDPEAWDLLRKQALPELIKARPQGGVLRVWVPACSTGEEAYSLAMVLTEALEEARPPHKLTFQIFATDLDKDAVEKARQGSYPANIAADVAPERLRRFFHEDEHGYRVRKEVREAVVFAPQNVITDPPFTKLDILSCRNLLIYLSAELQRRLIPLFHYSLNAGGLLFLGSAETVGGFGHMFAPLDGKSRVYQRLENVVGAQAVEFPSAFAYRDAAPSHKESEPEPVKPASQNLQILTDRVIVQRFAPATVLTNDRGDILYLSTRTGKYLEPAVGKANLNLFAMAREGLRYELASAFAKALKSDRPIAARGVKVRTNGSIQSVDVTVVRLVEPRDLRGTVMTVLADVASPAPAVVGKTKPSRTPASRRLADLEHELQHARDEAQTVREEMQTSQEELKSTNEELQSTNEELQSTNEELTTSKEEMQSMNEELQTVNHELQSKIDDLARSNNDMRNLLNSTEVATLFLDGELLVRRFTTPTAKIIKLIASDAGRPITDITTDLDYPTLSDDAREVLRTLMFKESEVGSRDGRWFSVRIMPYRTLENVIDGVVITFNEVTAAKKLEARLREQADELRQLAESLPNLVWGAGPDGACDYLSRQWIEYTGVDEPVQLGYGWLAQIHPDDRERVRGEWNTAVERQAPFDTEMRIGKKDGSYRWFTARWMPIRNERGAVIRWYGTCTDVDELKRAKQVAAESLSRVGQWIAEPAFGLDRELAVSSANDAAVRAVGRRREELIGKRLREIFPDAAEALDAKLREAMRDQRDLSFDVRIARGAHAGAYHVVALPHQQGAMALLRPADGRKSRGGDS